MQFATYGTGSFWVVRGVQFGSSFTGTDSVRMIYGGDD